MVDKLMRIQAKLKAPKGQRNTFGNYNYRSCEDILEAVKPLLAEEGCTLTLSDEIELIGDRYYIKATATLKSDKEEIQVSAYAREEQAKKGMDSAQVTGATSSYARKYALNGLFCIDDNKDPDTDEYTKQKKKAQESAKAEEKITAEMEKNAIELASDREVKTFMDMCEKLGVDFKQIGKQAGATSLKAMTKGQYAKATISLKEIQDSRGGEMEGHKRHCDTEI